MKEARSEKVDEVPTPCTTSLSTARTSARYFNANDFQNKDILDTSAWNALLDDLGRDELLKALRARIVIPTTLAITEMAATPDSERRQSLLQLVKTAGRDHRPLASPNQLVILACQGYARRDPTLTLCDGGEAEGAWMVLNDPSLVDSAGQKLTREFNEDRENIFRHWNERMREALQAHFQNGVTRPSSMGALIRHYNRDDDFLYEIVNLIYERAVGRALPRGELRPLLKSQPLWPMFLMGYACAIYQRAVRETGFGHARNPGNLDLWSATYLPLCDTFVTRDVRQRRTLKVINRGSVRPTRIVSYHEWREGLLRR